MVIIILMMMIMMMIIVMYSLIMSLEPLYAYVHIWYKRRPAYIHHHQQQHHHHDHNNKNNNQHYHIIIVFTHTHTLYKRRPVSIHLPPVLDRQKRKQGGVGIFSCSALLMLFPVFCRVFKSKKCLHKGVGVGVHILAADVKCQRLQLHYPKEKSTIFSFCIFFHTGSYWFFCFSYVSYCLSYFSCCFSYS